MSPVYRKRFGNKLRNCELNRLIHLDENKDLFDKWECIVKNKIAMVTNEVTSDPVVSDLVSTDDVQSDLVVTDPVQSDPVSTINAPDLLKIDDPVAGRDACPICGLQDKNQTFIKLCNINVCFNCNQFYQNAMYGNKKILTKDDCLQNESSCSLVHMKKTRKCRWCRMKKCINLGVPAPEWLTELAPIIAKKNEDIQADTEVKSETRYAFYVFLLHCISHGLS